MYMHTSNILKFKKIYTYKYDVFGFVFNMYSALLFFFLFVFIQTCIVNIIYATLINKYEKYYIVS